MKRIPSTSLRDSFSRDPEPVEGLVSPARRSFEAIEFLYPLILSNGRPSGRRAATVPARCVVKGDFFADVRDHQPDLTLAPLVDRDGKFRVVSRAARVLDPGGRTAAAFDDNSSLQRLPVLRLQRSGHFDPVHLVNVEARMRQLVRKITVVGQ